jgi:hypothetical protein
LETFSTTLKGYLRHSEKSPSKSGDLLGAFPVMSLDVFEKFVE